MYAHNLWNVNAISFRVHQQIEIMNECSSLKCSMFNCSVCNWIFLCAEMRSCQTFQRFGACTIHIFNQALVKKLNIYIFFFHQSKQLILWNSLRSCDVQIKTFDWIWVVKKIVLLLFPAFIWCLTTPHTKTYISLDFNAVQSKICFSFFIAYSDLNTPHADQSWKVKILTLVKLKFQYTRRHVNNISFVCVMYLMLHRRRNQSLWTNRCCHSELPLPVVPLMSLWINSVIFKSHEDKGTWANC